MACDCQPYVYHFENECCRARWLSTCFPPHGNAMLDRWQAHDTLTIGKQKAKAIRKNIINLAKEIEENAKRS